jgi:2-oxoglutarate dehydrogenase complex dehydrogenase (E1) component-like enzyme
MLMTPKSLLRHPQCKSEWKELQPPHRFMRVIPADAKARNPAKVVFCSGKFYYELLEQSAAAAASSVALIRLEQLAPFPFQEVVFAACFWDNICVILITVE